MDTEFKYNHILKLEDEEEDTSEDSGDDTEVDDADDEEAGVEESE